MSPVATDFMSIEKSELTRVCLADGSCVEVLGKGNVIVQGQYGLVEIIEVQFVPALSSRLLSVSKIYDRGGKVKFGKTSARIFSSGVRGATLVAPRVGSGWELDAEIISSSLPSKKPQVASCLLCSGKGELRAVRGAGAADLRASWEVWHQRLGHVGPQQLRRIAEKKLVSGLELLGKVPERHECAACLEGKMHNLPFGKAKGRATKPFERIHMDLMGKVEVESAASKARYVLTLKDEATRYAWVHFLRKKSHAAQAIKNFFHKVERQYETKVKGFRSDRGGEFLEKDFVNWLDELGVQHQLVVPYTPQQNGVAERYNRTLEDKARTMMFHAGLPKRFWEHAIRYANWCANRVPTSSLQGNITPYEALHARVPNVSMAKVFGCLAHIWVPPNREPKRKKFDPRAEVGVFLGMVDGTKGWEFWIPETGEVNRVSRNAYFHEDQFWPRKDQDGAPSYEAEEARGVSDPYPHVSFEYHHEGSMAPLSEPLPASPGASSKGEPKAEDSLSGAGEQPHPKATSNDEATVGSNDSKPASESGEDDDPSDRVRTREEEGSQGEALSPGSSPPASVIITLRDVTPQPERPVRARRPPATFSPTFKGSHNFRRAHAKYGEVFLAGIPAAKWREPRSVSEANRSEEATEWLEARMVELGRLVEMGCWELVEPPPTANILASLWRFTVKLNPDNTINKYKARLVINGSNQIEGVDYGETFASTAGRTTIRIFLAMVCVLGLHLHQLDITTAFLYGAVDKEIYMRQPPGHTDGTKRVCRLVRSLYGLKQAPRIWSETLNKALVEIGFTQSELDPSLYWLVRDGVTLWLLDFVDDILLSSVSMSLITWAKEQLMSRFKVTDMGPAQRYVGVHIHRDMEKGKMWLHQANYSLELVEKFKLIGKPFPDTPLPDDFVLHHMWESLNQGEDGEPPAELKGLAEPSLSEEDKRTYQRMVGCLNYAAHVTRPDIAFAVNQLSRATHNPRPRHLAAAERCILYLGGTADWGLHFDKASGMYLENYVDASQVVVSKGTEKHAMTGFILQVAGGAVSWTSRRQDRITTSTCDSESQAIMTSCQYVEHARDQLEELGHTQLWPTPVFNDNTAAVSLSKDPKAHNKSIQLTKPMAYVRQLRKRGVISPLHVRTEHQPADFLTKRLARDAFERCRWLSGMAPLPEEVLTLGSPPAVQGGV